MSLIPYVVAIWVRPSTTTWVRLASATATAPSSGMKAPARRTRSGAGLFGGGAHDDAALLCRGDRNNAAEDDDPTRLPSMLADDVLQRRLRRVLQRVVHGPDLLRRL